MNRRSILGLITAATLLGTTGVSFAADKPYIALISKGFAHQFWQAVKAGAEQAGKEFNVDVTFEGPEGEGAVDKQLDMISAAIAKHPTAIGIAAIDSKAVVPLLQQAADSGIIIVGFDSGVDSDIPVTTASTDNVAAAALAADKLAEAIGGEGEVGMVTFDQTSVTGADRLKGFTEEIKNKWPKITIDDIEFVPSGDHAQSADVTKTMLLAHPNIKGIFGGNEGTAEGVAIGKKEAKSNIVVVGYDSGAEQIAAVKDGTMLGSITQNPVGIGYQAVKAVVDKLAGKDLPKHIDTGFYWYDKTNIDDPKIAADLYN